MIKRQFYGILFSLTLLIGYLIYAPIGIKLGCLLIAKITPYRHHGNG